LRGRFRAGRGVSAGGLGSARWRFLGLLAVVRALVRVSAGILMIISGMIFLSFISILFVSFYTLITIPFGPFYSFTTKYDFVLSLTFVWINFIFADSTLRILIVHDYSASPPIIICCCLFKFQKIFSLS
jgi:hypothetical protein